jgi:arogenate dehydrogenase (NADP+), plant
VQNATEMLESLERAFDSVKSQLFQRLHDKLREELFPVMPDTYQQNGGASHGLLPPPPAEAASSPEGPSQQPDAQTSFANMDQAKR